MLQQPLQAPTNIGHEFYSWCPKINKSHLVPNQDCNEDNLSIRRFRQYNRWWIMIRFRRCKNHTFGLRCFAHESLCCFFFWSYFGLIYMIQIQDSIRLYFLSISLHQDVKTIVCSEVLCVRITCVGFALSCFGVIHRSRSKIRHLYRCYTQPLMYLYCNLLSISFHQLTRESFS